MSDAERTTRAPKRATTSPAPEVRETVDLGPLANAFKAGVMFHDGALDNVFNQTCPDWCTKIGRHPRDSNKEAAHWSAEVYTPMTGFRGYFTGSGKECDANMALGLKRVVGQSEPIITANWRHGDRDRERITQEVGRFNLDQARQLIECLQVLINAAEAES